MTQHLSIQLAETSRNIPLHVGSGALVQLPAFVRQHFADHRICVVIDTKVLKLHRNYLIREFESLKSIDQFRSIEGGELSKSREVLAQLQDQVLGAGYGRDTLVVAIGGGVIGDLVGFLASTLHRGLPLIQVPTTVLAQVDASIGGKVGINHPSGKNLLGAFHQPAAIFSDSNFLDTLTQEEFTNGLAEVIKIAVVADAQFVHFLQDKRMQIRARHTKELTQMILRAAELKAEIVMDDEREAGRRAILNFGHTAGHAIETLSNYEIKHGFAVAAGMRIALRLAERLCGLRQAQALQIKRLLADYGLESVSLKSFSSSDLWNIMLSDKKTRGGQPRFVLLSDLGRAECNIPVTYKEFADVFAQA